MKKILNLAAVFLICSSLFNVGTLNAYTGETYTVITGYEYRLGADSPVSYDVLEPIYPTSVYKVVVNNLDTGSTNTIEGEHTGKMHGLGCNNTYEMTMYDSADNLLGTDTVTVTDLQTTADIQDGVTCSSGGSGGEPTETDLLKQILNKIPPPPNWDTMTDTFNEKVTTKLINDMENMLGAAPQPTQINDIPQPEQIAARPTPTAPEPPTANLDDRGIEDKEPELTNPEGLEDSAFSENDLKTQAPVIEEREDTSGGFEINEPTESLPDLPTNDFPKPNEEYDSGEYGQNQPEQDTINFPDDPQPDETAEPIPENPPTPEGNAEPPPDPAEPTNAPTPDGTGDGIEGSLYYKNSPDG